MSNSTTPAQFDFSEMNLPDDFSFDIFGNSTQQEPLSMDDVDGADPGVFLPNTEGRTEFLAPDPERVPVIPNSVDKTSPDYFARPAEERTRELFAHMNPHAHVLRGVLEFTQTPHNNSEIAEVVERLRKRKFSVYNAANVCTMLETAGALNRITEDGTPFSEVEIKPNIVTIDGVEYYEASEMPCMYWECTDAGRAVLEMHDPKDKILRLLKDEAQYKALYKRVLLLALPSEGITVSCLSAAVDSDPLINDPREYFVQHFIEGLERCECIYWEDNAWHISELGQEILQSELSDESIDADFDLDAFKEANNLSQISTASLPTETQGVNW